jgi:hypothetical protein
MGVREMMERHRITVVVIALGIVLVSTVLAFHDRIGAKPGRSGEAFFSIDDGKTWFADDIRKIPPFEYRGKVAVRAYVFSCDDGKTKWTAYLERYTAAAKKQIEDTGAAPAFLGPMGAPGREIKRPGADRWIDASALPEAAKVIQLKCPHGGRHPVTPVVP